jgi:hypothetical protein
LPSSSQFFIHKVAKSIINALKDRSVFPDQKTGKVWNFLSRAFTFSLSS